MDHSRPLGPPLLRWLAVSLGLGSASLLLAGLMGGTGPGVLLALAK